MAGLANPVLSIRLPPPGKSRERRLSPDADEIGYIARHTESPILADIVLFAVEIGMRRGEIAGMVWDLVDLKKRTTVLLDTKNGSKRDVPLSTAAVRILERIPC